MRNYTMQHLDGPSGKKSTISHSNGEIIRTTFGDGFQVLIGMLIVQEKLSIDDPELASSIVYQKIKDNAQDGVLKTSDEEIERIWHRYKESRKS